MREPDQIDMMEEWELRAELRVVVQKLREAQERCERLESIGKRLLAELSIMDESEGIAGWHLNGDVSPWDEGDLPGLRDDLGTALSEPDEMTHEQDVFELRLCEQNHLILKPNQLYRFTVDETCEACRAIASEYAEPDEMTQAMQEGKL